MKSNLSLLVAISFAALSLSVSAAQPPNSNIEYLRPADLNRTPSQIPGSPHGHVRQRLGYGKGYRYGHSVNGPMGDIIIWSASPNRAHGSTSVMRSGNRGRPGSSNAFGPKLQYKPQYGKTSKPG